ncbi:hypothetical protein PCANC_17087 [Puccinia coronata f. sp. avenae]|uniref:Uncharacterized protein n=1 Tax=Puccinia coronata f. sp. avenae TaxID=200324 RepID=A0A2N5ST33_9BASI|nr:hypothetical protein PCANC_17087 [Puccinia coronata f. sp. avenae]PLW49022.1 hypothetical protein PCASD_05056 [Puccinia coronata f. sp. avenae]
MTSSASERSTPFSRLNEELVTLAFRGSKQNSPRSINTMICTFTYHVILIPALLIAAMKRTWGELDFNAASQIEHTPENVGYFASHAPSDANIMKDGTKKPFHYYDWSFLRQNQQNEESGKRQKQLLQFFKECKRGGDKDEKSFFFIKRNHAVQFLKAYKKKLRNSGFTLPPHITPEQRNFHHYNILRKISDDKINLGSYPLFSEEIVQAMMRRVRRSYQPAGKPPMRDAANRIWQIRSLITNVTKVTHLLMISVLSLFKEHKEGELTLTEDAIKEKLKFIQGLWVRLEEGKFQNKGDGWEKIVYNLLNAQTETRMMVKREKYTLCWNFVNTWLEENNMQLKKISREPTHSNTVTEIINKLILFSNFEIVSKKPCALDEE